ncbi:PREDICTED: TMV resistance protein N-like isoform X2 [Nelumbo nucifera]|uniref:TMV resistance protein N-like isoform X2 n=1 Tax=Nelumbo nucifera TaxID=4432 RepID=A0A1U8Q7L4_NELNU|nr:PREDICTED: TMV resistance protein N-like isoform X2 [Nelumbo nucifera]
MVSSHRIGGVSPLSSTTGTTLRWNYDVFLSFRGEDTRKIFVEPLYKALVHRGINTFKDDEELGRGKEIAPELLKAIEESRISVIIFSNNYTSSSWCLEELVKVIECWKRIGQLILPVFYEIDASEVQKRIGNFGEAFVKAGVNIQKVQMWTEALTEIAKFSRWNPHNFLNGNQSIYIQRIVKEVLVRLNKTLLDVTIYPVGLDSRVNEMNSLLDSQSDDVYIIGVCGIGGIGKTTIAMALYNQIFHRFEGCSFLANVREVSEQPNGLVHLQETLLSDILMETDLKINNLTTGIEMIKERLQHKRILLVLDDVDQLEQLEALAYKCNWFGLGSRIIITTRYEDLLHDFKVDKTYKVKELNWIESIQLFSWHAFKRGYPEGDYLELLSSIVDYAKGLPLALEVLGALLFRKSIFEWEGAIKKLKIPHSQIQKKLKVSFDALVNEEKALFLDIACFFVGTKKDYAIKILDSCGFSSEIGIRSLTGKSLVTINEKNEIGMHNLIQEMGKEIVREESPRNPGKRRRLGNSQDVHGILTKNMGTGAIEGLVIENSDGLINELNAEAFAAMQKLRFLKLNHVHLMGSYEHLPRSLRWLCWHGFPLENLPTKFHLENLSILDMQYSRIKQLWNGNKSLKELKILNLSHSVHMTKTPNFLGLPNLERLILEGCISLVDVHHSVGHLEKLIYLNLKNCIKLKDLLRSVWEVKCLESLILSGCSNLHMSQSKPWPLFLCYWKSLSKCPGSIIPPAFSLSSLCFLKCLDLSYCNPLEEPMSSAFVILKSLEELNLSNNNFSSLPDSISCLHQLKFLELRNCTRLKSLPKLPSSLMSLNADGCTSLETLSNLESLTSLVQLHLFQNNLCSLPTGLGGLSRLLYLGLQQCTRLQSIKELPSGSAWKFFCSPSQECSSRLDQPSDYGVCNISSL